MVVVKVQVDAFKNITKYFKDDQLASMLGQYLVDASKELIAIGMSPVRGHGRFVGYVVDRFSQQIRSKIRPGIDYKQQRAALRRKFFTESKYLYPNSIKKQYPLKKRRPVNLSLSGSFISKLGWRYVNKKTLAVGLYNITQKQEKMFEAHNEGMHPFVPQRKFLPTKKGEQYNVSIMRGLLNTFSRWIDNQIKKSS